MVLKKSNVTKNVNIVNNNSTIMSTVNFSVIKRNFTENMFP